MAALQFKAEVWVPELPEPPYVIQGTHRAYLGADSPQVAWIRGNDGPVDLSGMEVAVEVRQGGKVRMTTNATGDDKGRLDFTITAEGAKRRLRPGPYTLFAISAGRVIYTGLLEFVS